MIIPDFVKHYMNTCLNEKGVVRVDVNVYDKPDGKFLYKHGLDFGKDLHFHGMNGFTMSIEDYLYRTLTHTIKPITVCINGRLLTDIMPPIPINPPEEIDISHIE